MLLREAYLYALAGLRRLLGSLPPRGLSHLPYDEESGFDDDGDEDEGEGEYHGVKK